MTLAAGVRLGPYEIVAPLGAGGMGEVWRARDTRLGREVAIKVLPEAFAAEPALRARFDREAKTISSLNHPNICTLYDVGREGDTDFLVLELVEGETLALRIARGPLPLAELLRFGLQMTDALEKAHKAGIVHRDLKPGNIMLTKSGAKLLDFGLARGGALAGAPVDATISPTMTGPLTAQGHIVGTFQYMAPEQLEGSEADARSDLWALGCVLYEMATGKPAFAGASQASLISSIMKDEPRSLGELAPMSPPALDRAIRQCLAKDPDERWQTAGDLRRELAWISASGSQASAISSELRAHAGRGAPSLARRVRAWALPFVAGLALAGAAWFAFGRSGGEGSAARLSLLHPGVGDISPDPADLALSPDGTSLAYVVGDSTGAELWVRRLGEERGHVVDRSPGPIRTPFWSADSRQVAYFTSGDEGRLWRVPAEGGSPVPLAPASSGRGGAWSRGGVIVFAPAPAGPLLRVSASGGDVTQATVLDTTAGETAHRAPRFLPDDDHFLFTALPSAEKGFGVKVGSVKGGKSELVTHLPQGGAEYAAPGFILFSREGKLVARGFDAGSRRLAEETFVVADAVGLSSTSGHPIVSASRSGRLAWLPQNRTNNTRVEWVDRGGRSQGSIEAPDGGYYHLTVAADGRRALLTRYRVSGEIEVYAYDPERGALQRASPAGAVSYQPVWAPDGDSFYMRSGRAGRDEVVRVSLSQPGEPVILETTDHQFKGPTSVSADGRTLVFIALGKDTGWDVWAADPTGATPPRALVDETSDDFGYLSPDGRWLALVPAGGPGDLSLAPIDRPRSRKRVATGVGSVIEWSPSGRELLFQRDNNDGMGVFSLPIDPATGTVTGPEQLLFRRVGAVAWGAAPDGSRFLLSIREGAPQRVNIELALDWTRLPRAK